MFWTGFTTALMLLGGVAVFRWLRAVWLESTPHGAACAQAHELHRCGMVLHAQGIREAAIQVWLRVASQYPQYALNAEYSLSRLLLSGAQTDEAWVHAYEALLRAHPSDGGLLYKLGKIHHNLGHTVQAQEYWRQVLEFDDAGWKDRAAEDLAATDAFRIA